jgi:hypothetical protein
MAVVVEEVSAASGLAMLEAAVDAGNAASASAATSGCTPTPGARRSPPRSSMSTVDPEAYVDGDALVETVPLAAPGRGMDLDAHLGVGR